MALFFYKIGATYNIENADFVQAPTTAVLKAIFDIDYLSKDASTSNFLISSLHRYLNMHVKNGVEDFVHVIVASHFDTNLTQPWKIIIKY